MTHLIRCRSLKRPISIHKDLKTRPTCIREIINHWSICHISTRLKFAVRAVPGHLLEASIIMSCHSWMVRVQLHREMNGDQILWNFSISEFMKGGHGRHISPEFLRRETLLLHLPPIATFTFSPNVPYLVNRSSNVLSQIIAIFQLSSVVLQLRHIHQDPRLASPYLVVIPYLLMTLVNFIANAVVGSYPQVVILPIESTSSHRVLSNNREPHDRLEPELRDWLKQHYSYLNIEDLSFPERKRGVFWRGFTRCRYKVCWDWYVRNYYAVKR